MTFFYKVLHVEQEERISVVLFLFLGFCLGGFVALTEVANVSIFIKLWKQTDFPIAFFLAGLSGLLTTHYFTKLQNWMPLSVIGLCGLAILFIGNLFIFYSYQISSNTTILYNVILFSTVNCIIPFQLFWAFFHKIYDPLQIKKLRIRIELGLIAGATMALSLVIYFIEEQNTAIEYLYLFASTLLIFSGIVVIAFSFNFSIVNKITSNVQYIATYNNYISLLRNPYLRSILNYSFLSGLSLGLIDFIFYSIVKENYETIYDTVSYLSIFTVVGTLLGYLIATTLSSKINKQYGKKVCLLILPCSLLVFALLYLCINLHFGYSIEDDSFYLLFIMAASCKILYSILYKGFEFNTIKIYFIPIDIALRYDFQCKTEFFARQFGRFSTGVIALSIISFFGGTFSGLSGILVLIILLWIITTYTLNKRYHHTLQNSLQKECNRSNEKTEILSYTDELVYDINQIEQSKLGMHLNMLNILDAVKYKKAIYKLLLSEDNEIQYIALCEVEKLCMLETIEILEAIQKSKKYFISKNRTFIFNTYIKLKEAKFRLKKIKYVEQLTLSKITSERRFGALLVAYSDNTMKVKLLNKLLQDVDYQVRQNAIKASLNSNNKELYKNLIKKLSDQQYSNAALTAILNTGEEIFPYLEADFFLNGQTERIQLIIIKIYEKVASEKAIALLTKKLNYTNQTITVAVVNALSRNATIIRDEKKNLFRRGLEDMCRVIVWNMSAYIHLNYQNTSPLLLSAVKAEIDTNYTSLFKLLSLLYNPNSVSKIKENIDSTTNDKKEFATQLLQALISEELKPLLLPILAKESYKTTVLKMKNHFPTAPIDQIEILYDLIQRDYNWINRWTKVCALKELAESGKYKDTDIFIANLINPDELLQEISAIILYEIDKIKFSLYSEKYKSLVDTNTLFIKIINYEYFPELKFEIICFLKKLEVFKEMSFIILLELAKTMTFVHYQKNELIVQCESHELCDYYFSQNGLMELKINNEPIRQFTKGNFVHFLDYTIQTQATIIELKALEISALYIIQRKVFHELIFLHEEIAQEILKHHSHKKALSELTH